MAEVARLRKNVDDQDKSQSEKTQSLESNIDGRLRKLEQDVTARLVNIEKKVPYSKSRKIYIVYTYHI